MGRIWAFLAFVLLVQVLAIDASGDFGDFGKAQTKLDDEVVATYFTENKVVGRGMEEGRCSSKVFEQREKTKQKVYMKAR